MLPMTPEETHLQWAEYFNAGDIDSIMTLYEPDARFVVQPGQVLAGADQIRQGFQQFLALKPRIRLTPQLTLQTSDIALLIADWVLTGTGPDGCAVELHGRTVDVIYRQTDGYWLYAVDNPDGDEAVPR